MQERDKGAEKLHPNQVINGAMNYYILRAVENGILKERPDPKIMIGIIRHMAADPSFAGTELLPHSSEFQDQRDSIVGLGEMALDAYKSGQEVKALVRGRFDPRLIAYAPQALLFTSYVPLLENLADVSAGRKQYGFGKALNRLQPHNAFAAGEMMKGASKKIAEEILEMSIKRNMQGNLAVLELGCGNASFSASVVESFEARGLRAPYILATDIDPKTQGSALSLFKQRGLGGKLNTMALDMGNRRDLEKAANRLQGKNVIVHIGYILHEERNLAKRTLEGLVKAFGSGNTVFAFSEYYMQDQISYEVPLWFQTLHEFTQELFGRDELIKFVGGYGLNKIGENIHNQRKDNGDIMNSTTFWEPKRQFFYTVPQRAIRDIDMAA